MYYYPVKVCVVKSKHSSVTPGMVGEGIRQPTGWEVTFEKFKHQTIANEPVVEKPTTIWFTPDEIEIINENPCS